MILWTFSAIIIVSTLKMRWDFLGGPVARTLHSQCIGGPRFDPWSGNWIPHAPTKSSDATKILHAQRRSKVPHATIKTQHSQIDKYLLENAEVEA